MNRYRYFYLICLCIVSVSAAAQQGANNNWCFGKHKGISFNVNPPAAFTDSMVAVEGCSSVSDAEGNLLFYTSGGTVWNRNHEIMPNGAGLSGNGPLGPNGINVGSSTHGVAIVQSPSNADQYYIITTDAIEDGIYNAYHTLVDMTLNDGLGDVVTDQMNVLFASDVVEGVYAVRSADCLGYWVILHKRYGSDFLAFKIGLNGFENIPVVSSGLNGSNDLTQLQYGQCAFHPDGSMMLHNSTGGLEIASFDNVNGSLYDFVLITNNSISYPVFSPDGSKMYFFQNGWYNQADISLFPDISAIQNSITPLDSGFYLGARVAPDGKLYVKNLLEDNVLSVIQNPNSAGLACNFTAASFPLPDDGSGMGSGVFAELGADALINPITDTIAKTVLDTVICFDTEYTLTANPAYEWAGWNTGSNESAIQVNQSGTYWCYGWKDCNVYIDSFRLKFVNFESPLGGDTVLCPGDTLVLDATLEDAAYLWQDGSDLSQVAVHAPGRYWLYIMKSGCRLSDTVIVSAINISLNIVEPDTLICEDTPLTLHAIASPESSYTWSTGDTDSAIVVNHAGIYTVTATNVCGILQDSVQVQMFNCDCRILMPNAFSPNNDGRNDEIRALMSCNTLEQFTLTIFNRYGQAIFETSDPNQGWDGNYNGSRADVGVYFYYIVYKADGATMKLKGDFTLLR